MDLWSFTGMVLGLEERRKKYEPLTSLGWVLTDKKDPFAGMKRAVLRYNWDTRFSSLRKDHG